MNGVITKQALSCTRATCGYRNFVEECLGRELYLSLSDCDRHMQPWSSQRVKLQENGDKLCNKIRLGWKMKEILHFTTHFISFHIPIHIFSQTDVCQKMWAILKTRHIRLSWSNFTTAFYTPFHNAPCNQKMEKLHFTTFPWKYHFISFHIISNLFTRPFTRTFIS